MYSTTVTATHNMSYPVWNVPHLASGSQKPVLDPDQVYIYNMRFCPYAERTMLVLLAKEVNFKVININLKKKPDWFTADTFGLVPVVLYKGDIIPESLITSDLVDEFFPGESLTPADPVAKAKDRVVLEIFGKLSSGFYKTLLAKEDDLVHAAFKDVLTIKDKVAAEYKKRGTTFFCGGAPGEVQTLANPSIKLACQKLNAICLIMFIKSLGICKKEIIVS